MNSFIIFVMSYLVYIFTSESSRTNRDKETEGSERIILINLFRFDAKIVAKFIREFIQLSTPRLFIYFI